MKLLVVSPFPVHPITFGGQKDLLEKIEIFKELVLDIDLVYCGEKMADESNSYVNRFVNKIHHVQRTEGFKSLLCKEPYQVVTRRLLEKIHFEEKYDVVLLEGEYVGGILKNSTLNYKSVILRVHNDEVNYFKNLFKSVVPKLSSIYYYTEHIKFREYVKKLHTKIDQFWCVSSEEAEWFSKKYTNKEVYHLPVAVKLSEIKKADLKNNEVLFIGALNMPNNIQGVKWYLEKIHPIVKKRCPNYIFNVVGSTKGSDLSWLKDLEKTDINLKVNFDVPDLDFYYNKSSVFINPMLQGAGVKVKSINSIIEGLPIVSTIIGAEGLGLTDNENVLIGKNASEFANKVILLLNDQELRKRIAKNSQDFIKREFDVKSKIKSYLQ